MLNFRKIFIIPLLLLAPVAPSAFTAEAEPMALFRASDGEVKFSLNTPAAGAIVAPEATVEPASYTAAILRAVGLLLLVGGTGLLLVWHKRRANNPKSADAPQMKLLERLSLGARRELLLVRAGERLLVIGSQATQMTLLSDVAADQDPTAPFSQVLFEKDSNASEPKRPLPPPPIEQIRDTVSVGVTARGKVWPGLENAS